MEGLFGDGLVNVLCCGGDSLEEDLHWGPRLLALVDLVEFVDGVTSCGVTLFKTVEALSRGAFFFSTSSLSRQQPMNKEYRPRLPQQGQIAVSPWPGPQHQYVKKRFF